jgi:hypothetical protein
MPCACNRSGGVHVRQRPPLSHSGCDTAPAPGVLLLVYDLGRIRLKARRPRPRGDVTHHLYSVSRRAFFRLRLRAKACLTRSFWPGFK